MQVAVETFECSETAAEPIEATEEAVSLMESLGLEGQLTLVRGKTADAPAARCPYREMTAEEFFVYGKLCPAVIKLKDYSAAPVPLRVLQLAAHAQTLGMFRRLEVWDRESVLVKDPVLVGIVTDPNYEWMTKTRFILARWGEVLEPFVVLRKRALEVHRQTLLDEAAAMLRTIEGANEAELMKHSSVKW